MRKKWYYPIFLEGIVVLLIHGLGIYVMTDFRLLDQMLSPGPESSFIAIALGAVFTCVRLFVILFLPGWILARLFWGYTLPVADSVGDDPA